MKTINLRFYKIWFVAGSQELYGKEVLRQVDEDARLILSALRESEWIPVSLHYGGVVTDGEGIARIVSEINANPTSIGLITWMHTFSPAKMWIRGLGSLQKPLLQLHTQFNIDIPWQNIDMDYMNLHQSAHGGREFGFIGTRLDIKRKVVVGHWSEKAVQRQLSVWCRVCCGWADHQQLKIARFGDNMREVAVTEGNKVSAQIKFGYQVEGYGLGDLVEHVEDQDPRDVRSLATEYTELFSVQEHLLPGKGRHESLLEAAKLELGLRSFLEWGGFKAFTDTFENLHGLDQLPGIAVQRLMYEGYGFGAEGDWKTAALLRLIKVMTAGLAGGSSFMEDYTYHLGQSKVLGAHMLEVCPSISDQRPRCEIHPLQIGGKADPVRLVFTGREGIAYNTSMIDLGDRFRLIVNKIEAQDPPEKMPNLPVARVFWHPKPDLAVSAAAWIYCGGAHHTVYSDAINIDYFVDFAELADIELVIIDEETDLKKLKKELRWENTYRRLGIPRL